MSLFEMVTAYERLSAATSYIIGFVFHGDLYMVKTQELPHDLLKLDRMSSKRGGWAKVRVRLNSKVKAELATTATKLGAADLLKDDHYNKGECFERVVTESYGLAWTKDNVPCWKAGDISLNGEEIQIKFDGAELTNEKLLRRMAA